MVIDIFFVTVASKTWLNRNLGGGGGRSGGGGGGRENSLYFVQYRRAGGRAPILQVIYTSIGHDFISNIHL